MTPQNHDLENSMMELRELAQTAGVQVVEEMRQHRDKVDPRTCIGRGKLSDLTLHSMQLDAELAIFDTNLTPTQVRAIADATEIKVIDRTQLILDIFAQRARSREGKLQVELAQLKYMLPRLSRSTQAFSRLAGGIGGRGPGEQKLEVDRRRVKDRITLLQKQLKKVALSRSIRRRQRNRNQVPVVSIVGYTNAGKSTLLNTLTHSKVLVEDKLFATLDPTSRRLRFPRDREIVITDTVGFIRDLPQDLIQAFSATLEEMEDADALLHVVDISSPNVEEQIATVDTLLHTLKLDDRPVIRVLNKADRLADKEMCAQLETRLGGIAVCARSSETLGPLLTHLDHILWQVG
jgi:GTP-binding protein HflX